MTVLIIGSYSDEIRKRIISCFPQNWNIIVSEPSDAHKFYSEAEVLIPEHTAVDAQILSDCPKLRMIQTGSGSNNVDITKCSERGIIVCSAAGVNKTAVAEHAIALILAWHKNIIKLDNYMKGSSASPIDYRGSELHGMTIGIIGYGEVGKTLASLCTAFGMNVITAAHNGKEAPGIEFVPLNELLMRSDIVSLNVPLNDTTYHMIDASSFRLMKSSALLVNASRGAVVDEAALIDALSRNVIAGACLDVFETEPLPEDSPLRRFSNVILTPHTAGYPDGNGFHLQRFQFFAKNISEKLVSCCNNSSD